MQEQAIPSHQPRTVGAPAYPLQVIGPCPATEKHRRRAEWSGFWRGRMSLEMRGFATDEAKEASLDLVTWARRVSEELETARKRSQKVDHQLARHIWMVQRLFAATDVLSASVTVDPEVRGGVPVLRGTRVPLSQLLAEVTDDRTLSDIAEDKDLDLGLLKAFFGAMATYLDRPFAK